MPPYGMLPVKTPTFGQQFLPALLMGTMGGYQQRKQTDYEQGILNAILSGKPPQEAIAMPSQKGGLAGILSGLFGGRPSASNLSPFTQQVLASAIAPKLRDPLETRMLEAQARGAEAGATRTEIENDQARLTNPVERKRLGMALEAQREELANMKKTNPTRAAILEKQLTALDEEMGEERLRRPIGRRLLDIQANTAEYNLNQSRDMGDYEKSLMTERLRDIRQKISQAVVLEPAEIEKMQAEIDNIKASTEERKAYKGYLEGNKGKVVQPITFTQLKSAGDIADKLIEGAKISDVGGFNYTKENLTKQYEKFRTLNEYGRRDADQQAALDQIWHSRVMALPARHEWLGNEVEWSDEIFDQARGKTALPEGESDFTDDEILKAATRARRELGATASTDAVSARTKEILLGE